MKTLIRYLKRLKSQVKGVLDSDAQTQFWLEYLIINLHKKCSRGSYNLKIMREIKQRTSKGKFTKKSGLYQSNRKNLW